MDTILIESSAKKNSVPKYADSKYFISKVSFQNVFFFLELHVKIN